jgi:hypothetical protein
LDVVDRIVTSPGYVWLPAIKQVALGQTKVVKTLKQVKPDKSTEKAVQFLVDRAVVDSLAVMTSAPPNDSQTILAATRSFMDGLDFQLDNLFAPAAIRDDGQDEMERAIAASLRDY